MAEGYNTDVLMDDGTMIHTTVTSSSLDVQRFIEEVQGSQIRIAGLDAEWRPNRTRGAQQYPIAVLQLCVDRRCLVYQIIHGTGIPISLCSFLYLSGFTFVGVGIADDAKRLRDEYSLLVSNAVDLRELAANSSHRPRPELRRAGLKDLALAVMGPRIAKPPEVTMSDWEAPSLSRERSTH
nr:Werner Syndrome-like exonuclease [Aegilops tauschii subsp. strangulata]